MLTKDQNLIAELDYLLAEGCIPPAEYMENVIDAGMIYDWAQMNGVNYITVLDDKEATIKMQGELYNDYLEGFKVNNYL